jgi:hypothetical protein
MSVGGDAGGQRGETVDSARVEFDTSKPNIARVYDVLLGGKDNYAADREQAERIVALNPGLPGLVRDNRAFIIKAVTRAASLGGIRQFIDLGAGLPTHPSVHEAAQGVSPDARVAYVDHDPVVQSHVRALLAGDGVVAIGADITRPADVLADPELTRVIDFGQPVCVILAAVLHFQPAEVARSLIAEYAAPLAAGSALLVSVFSAADEEFTREATRTYTAGQWHSHSPAELERWLREAGLRPLRGHVGRVSNWPLEPPGRTAAPAEPIGDLAEKLLRPGLAGLPPSLRGLNGGLGR